MAYNENLADRVRTLLLGKENLKEKKMLGGLSFLINGKMTIGVLNDDLVVRVDPNESDVLLKKTNVRPMNFTGKPMKGFLYVGKPGYTSDKDLKFWLEKSISFVKTLKK